MRDPSRSSTAAETARPLLDVRARTRELLRDELSATARELFAEHGFDNVTVDEIAAAAGASRRTFFRYFATKEEAVFRQLELLGHDMARELEARPAEEPAWDSLRAASHTMLRRTAENPEAALRLYQMFRTTPSLTAGRSAKQHNRMELLIPIVRARLLHQAAVSPDMAEIAANALTGSALSCLDTALEIWAASDGAGSPEPILDSAMALVGALTPASAG
jgi:AcrR family transcriptional regulator